MQSLLSIILIICGNGVLELWFVTNVWVNKWHELLRWLIFVSLCKEGEILAIISKHCQVHERPIYGSKFGFWKQCRWVNSVFLTCMMQLMRNITHHNVLVFLFWPFIFLRFSSHLESAFIWCHALEDSWTS